MSSGSRSSMRRAWASPGWSARSPTSSSRPSGGKGQFEWTPDFRAHFARAQSVQRVDQLFRQEPDWLDYTLSVEDRPAAAVWRARADYGRHRRADRNGATRSFTAKSIFYGQDQARLSRPRIGQRQSDAAGTPYFNPSLQRRPPLRADGDDRSRVIRDDSTASITISAAITISGRAGQAQTDRTCGTSITSRSSRLKSRASTVARPTPASCSAAIRISARRSAAPNIRGKPARTRAIVVRACV